MAVAVLVEPVEGGAGGAGAVEARRADDDDLVGRVEDAAGGGLEDAGAGVEADEVVVALEQTDRALELVLADRLRDPRVVVGGDDLEPARRLRGVAADVGVALDPSGVREQGGEVRGRLAPDAVAERSRVGVAVDARSRGRRGEANVWPASRHVLVLPTPPLREMNATLRQPAIGVLTCATSSRCRSSAGLGPHRDASAGGEKTARRHPPDGTSGLGPIIRSGREIAGAQAPTRRGLSSASALSAPGRRLCEARRSRERGQRNDVVVARPEAVRLAVVAAHDPPSVDARK